MERTISSLTYKGSIPDAINQSRREKKLFVVYISGENEASSSLEQSTLLDDNVVEVIGRCCIFLHLKHGNVDASQFAAIYPQKTVPTISVIGLNGVLLWNHEGYISSGNLKESIENAWASLHLQETAVALLTASLASRNAESVNTTPTVPSQGGSATSDKPSASSSKSPDMSGAVEADHPTDLVSQLPSSTSLDPEPSKINAKEDSKSDSDANNGTMEVDSLCTEVKSDLPDCSRSSNMSSSTDLLEGKNKVDGNCREVPSEPTLSTITSREVTSQLLVEEYKTTSSAPNEPVSNSAQSDDIQLSIRMPGGNRLEIKLTKQDVLRKVKNFVDENKGSGFGSYDLSMIYPKRIFAEQDMEATLSELGIQNRQAMIVVPNRQPVQTSRPQLSSPYEAGGNSVGGGYFGYLRRVLSYVNPLSYWRGDSTSSNPELQAAEGTQQHGSNSAQWSRPGTTTTSDESSASTLRKRSRPFGANVHTLGSEDRDGPSDDRNRFWNGNSTEFGGDDRK